MITGDQRDVIGRTDLVKPLQRRFEFSIECEIDDVAGDGDMVRALCVHVLHQRVEHVTAIEGRTANLEKARLVQRLLGVDNVTFVEADLETAELDGLGRFDSLFCVGLLYHLPQPWTLIDRFSSVTDRVFLQTHYAATAEETRDGRPGRSYPEYGSSDPLSGLSHAPFWLTLPALNAQLERNGYAVRELERNLEHPNGPIVTLVAQRSSPGGHVAAHARG